MKRMLSLILTLGMLLALVPASAVASGSFDVVTPPPINPHWEYSDYLLAVWEAPEGADEFTCYDIEIFYSPNGGDDAKTLVDFWNDWEKDTAYAIRADIMAEHGRGYYYFCVRTAATADAPASEWVWSGPYFYSPTGISAVMAAPSGVALSGDSLVWDPIENGLAVISAYYCGEDGTADPTLVGTNYTYGSIQQVQPANFQHNYNAPGVYTYTISAFSDNYLTVGQSETVSVPGTFVVEKKDGPEGPTGLYWSESNSPRWDVITDGSVVYDVEMGIAYDMDTDPRECAFWIPLFEGFDGSSEAFLAGALWMEFDYMSQAYMMELGGEFFAFRVRSVPADGNGEPSEWSYSLITPLSNGDDPGQSPEDLPQLTTSNPRWEEETMAMLWDTDQPQQVEHYQMRFYWSEQPVDDIPFEDYFEADYTMPTWDAPTLNGYLLSINGTGYYYFRVRAVTLDSNVIRTSEWSALSPALYFTAPTEEAPAPYDLQWHLDRSDSANGTYVPGAISFGGTVLNDNFAEYRVDFYRVGSRVDEYLETIYMNLWSEEPYATVYPLEEFPEHFTTGSYYFTVTPMGDGIDTIDGQPVKSPVWEYVRPELTLTASNLHWNGASPVWEDTAQNSNQIQCYEVRYYFSKTENASMDIEDWHTMYYYEPLELPVTIPSDMLQDCGEGYYYYRVQVVSSDPTVAFTGSWSEQSSAYVYKAPSEKAPAPYDLQWGVERWDNSVSYSAPGAISFGGTVTGAYSKFRVALYQMDPFGDRLVATWQTRIYEGEQYATLFPLEDYDFPSGSYYFTVQAIGDGLLTTDSDPVTSPVWEYVRPDLALNATNPAWDGRNPVWDLNASDHLVRYFDVQFFYSASANPVFGPDDWTDWYTFEPDETATIPTRMLRDYGEGYYAFRVRAISADPTAAFSGQWSEVSPVYHFELSATQLPAPYDLQWHVQRWDSNNGYSDPGAISFGGTVLNGNFAEYRVDFYRVGSRVDEYLETLYVDLWSEEPYTTAYPLDEFPEHFTTGTYYFVVTALGDGILYTDSESVVSPMWDYVQPAVKLEASNPVWNSNMSLNWTSGSDLDLLESFQVEFYYNAIANDPAEARMVGARSYGSSTYAYPAINNLRNGTGWYFFRVRAVSGDINEAQSSDWSDLSAGFYYTDPGKQITLSNLRWDESTMASQWDANVDESDICYYQVLYYFSETENGNPEQIGKARFYPGIDSPYVIPSYYLQDYGQGYYRFAVRAYSANPTKVSDNSNYSATSAALHYAGAELQLGTPSALKWNVEYDWNGGESTRMGSIGFKRADPDQNRYEVDIYRVGEDEPVGGSSWSFGSNNSRQYLDVPNFIYDDLPSGTYYFKIRAKGDGINYNHGEWVTSDTWIYTAPAERLDVPTNIRWDDSGEEINILWDSVENAAYYEVSYYFSPTKDGSRESVGGTFDINNTETDLSDWIIEDRGIGWYFVKIRAIPQDITQFRLSEWSEFSIGYNLSQLSGDIIGSLEAIDPNAPVADIQQAVSNIPHLDEAMAADKDNSGAVEQIAALERGMGETTVDTSNAPAGFDAADVQVTGAVLNAGADATLEIGSVSASTAPPELNPAQYNNTVTFTMDIPQAEDKNPEEAGLQLAVPVKITLPIPGNINPAFLVVLHYQQSTGEWEELLWPHVYQEGGKWYATFVVDSMSPFALAERQVEAFVRDAGVVVTAYLPTAGEDVRFLCALYRGNGQMVGMTILDPHSDVGQLIPADEVTEDMYVKVLSVDTGNGWQPVSNDQEVAISF